MTGPNGPSPDPGQHREDPPVSSPTAPLPTGWAGPAAPHTGPAPDPTEPGPPARRSSRATVVLALVLTGLVAARFSDAEPRRAVVRNVLGGSVAMAVTYAVGSLVGLAV